jgi:hypothetical protein
MRAPLRRKAFDEIVQGWGGDALPDLQARLELVMEWAAGQRQSFTAAEFKIAEAMKARVRVLEGA